MRQGRVESRAGTEAPKVTTEAASTAAPDGLYGVRGDSVAVGQPLPRWEKLNRRPFDKNVMSAKGL